MSSSDKCAVCHVRTGSIAKHYNVLTCLGCKTFFRRAVTKKRRYFCEVDQNCDVRERSGRQSCRYCRLKVCYAVGMQERALKGKRDAVGIRNNSFDSPPHSVDHSNQDLIKLIQELKKTDENIRHLKQERFRSMTEAMKLSRAVAINNIIYPAYFGREDLRLVDVIDMACVTSNEMHSLLDWAPQSLPFFQQLPIDCRTNLIRKFAVHQLVIEAGYHTARSKLDDVWLFPNNTCMPRDIKVLPVETQRIVTPARAWRQEKLYRDMTYKCIDDVAVPMKKLDLLPEELVTLKVIMFCQFGIHLNSPDQSMDEISEHKKTQSLKAIKSFKNQVISALFEFYKLRNMIDYEERFGNVLLLISGIVEAATLLHESYHIMSVFGIVPFDRVTNLLLF